MVELNTQSRLNATKPRPLFDGAFVRTTGRVSYDVSPDGQHFVMLNEHEGNASSATQINVVLNWFEELKRRVAAK